MLAMSCHFNVHVCACVAAIYNFSDNEGKAYSRSNAFVKAIRFASNLGIYMRPRGAFEAPESLAIPVLQRARALTVDEVVLLHRICEDDGASLQRRVIASHALLMPYGRCKVSE